MPAPLENIRGAKAFSSTGEVHLDGVDVLLAAGRPSTHGQGGLGHPRAPLQCAACFCTPAGWCRAPRHLPVQPITAVHPCNCILVGEGEKAVPPAGGAG